MGALETVGTLALQMNLYKIYMYTVVLTNEGDGFQWKSEEESVQLIGPQLLYDGLHRRPAHNHKRMLLYIPKLGYL